MAAPHFESGSLGGSCSREDICVAWLGISRPERRGFKRPETSTTKTLFPDPEFGSKPAYALHHDTLYRTVPTGRAANDRRKLQFYPGTGDCRVVGIAVQYNLEIKPEDSSEYPVQMLRGTPAVKVDHDTPFPGTGLFRQDAVH
eukprot:2310245-Rhodomonas_salina.8